MSTHYRFIEPHEKAQQKAHASLETRCPHVEAQIAPLWVVVTTIECGDAHTHGFCHACYETSQEVENRQEVICHDCEEHFLLKDTRAWKPCDAVTGEEAIYLCLHCQKQFRHLNRLKLDQEARQQMDDE